MSSPVPVRASCLKIFKKSEVLSEDMFPLSSYKSILFVLYLAISSILIDVVANAIDDLDNEASIGPELEKELRLTKNEKQALDKFKLALAKDPPRPYFRTDLYQIRWLRANLLDVDRAVKEAHEFAKYYRRQKVSNIWKHDWSDVFSKHTFAIDGFDKNGLPILTMSIGDLDTRRIVLQGKRDKYYKYIANVGFEIFTVVNDINKKQPNITQFAFLLNLDGFNTIQQGCPLCIQVYINIMQLHERFLPGMTHDFILINTPSTFEIILEMLRPVFSSHTRHVMKVFGTNKSKWKPYLDSKIDQSQRTWEFGGTKVVDRDD